MTKKKTTVGEGLARWRVTTGATGICHGDKVYNVRKGIVDLPAAERTWWQDLVDNGTLVPAEDDHEDA